MNNTMDDKISKVQESLSELKKEYKNTVESEIPEIMSKIKSFEDLALKIEALETELKSISNKDAKEADLKNETDTSKFENIWQKQPKPETEETVKDKKLELKQSRFFLIFIRILKTLAGPFESIFENCSKFYSHYKDQGKGPAFLMSLAGIIALVSGFAYLVQYSFSNLLSEWSKILLIFISGISTIGLGYKLYSKNENLREFASGIIGLGVIINYLAIYGAGPYYNLINPEISFILLILNTIFAFFLSVHFNTRIVSFIAMTGGIFFPLLIHTNNQDTTIYLLYLLFLSSMILFVGYKIKWEILSYITIISALFMVRVSMAPTYFHLLVVNLFFYLFFYFLVFTGKKIKENLSRKELTALAGIFIFLAEVSLNITPSIKLSGLILGFNALFFIFLFSKFLQSELRSIFVIFSGLFALVSIFSIAPPEFKGCLFGIESLILIYSGFRFKEVFIRREGYFLFLISICGIVFTITQSLIIKDIKSLVPALISLFAAGIYLFIIKFLMKKANSQLDKFEIRIEKIVENLILVWLSGVYLYLLHYFFPKYFLVGGALIFPYISYKAITKKLYFGECFALSHLIFPICQVLISIIAAGSMIFLDLNLLGKTASIEIFLSMILIFYIYNKTGAKGHLQKIATNFGYGFFILLPVCFLPSSIKYFYQYLSVILWISAVVSILVFLFSKKKFILIETELLFIAASIFGAFYSLFYIGIKSFAIDSNIIFYSAFVSIPIGAAVYSALLYFSEKTENKNFIKINSGAFFFFGYVIFLYVSIIFKNFIPGICIASIYSLWVSFKRPVLKWNKKTYPYFFIFTLAASFIVGMAPLIIEGKKSDLINTIFYLLPVCSLVFLIHQEKFFLNKDEFLFKYKNRVYFIFNFIVVLFFISFLKSFNLNPFGHFLTILLVIQGVVVLFGTLTNIYEDCNKIPIVIFIIALIKFLILDLTGLALIEKIIALMGVGIVLMAGAYQFQKIRLKKNTPS